MEGYVIYKLCCYDCDDFYVGSTKNFTRRKSEHKKLSSHHHYKVYEVIRNNGGWDNWRMVVLEELGDITKRQAEMREEHWRVQIKATLNHHRPFVTEEQKREENITYSKKYHHMYRDILNNKHKEYYKDYYEENKKKIAEQRKDKVLCECGIYVRKIGHTEIQTR